MKPKNESSGILIPPGMEPIAYILYDSDYKSKLSALVRNAPINIADNTNWWKQLKIVTKATNEEITNIRTQHLEMSNEKAQKTGKVFDKLSETPVIRQDQELQKLIKLFAKNIAERDNKNINELLALQKKVQQRIQKLDEIIRQKEAELVNNRRSTVSESKEIISEGFISKTLSKVRQYLASDAFKKLLNIGEDGSEIAQLDAKTIVRDVLQTVSDRMYATLKESGIEKKMLIKAYRMRKEEGNLELLKKAKKILTGKSIKTEQPPKPTPEPVAEPTPTPEQPEATPQKQPDGDKPHNAISMMKQMMDAARRKAKESGIDEYQAAENLLQQFEERGIDDAPVVRRMWDKYREKKKATQP